jgi:TPR repeat protein
MIAEDQILDGYRLIRRIGTGGFGDVWLCEPQVMPGVRKALKWVPGAILPKLERELAALIQYQQVSQKLRQANLVPIEHINRTAEGLFYVMPLADGLHATTPDDPAWRSASLLGLIESHRKAKTWFRSQEIIHLMMPVLDALQQLSDIGIVHRDVKPENILLINGLPFLADISLLGEDTIDMTHRGTPGFVAPSWYLESGGHPDQYSAAATLYCLLTGNSPDKMGRSAFRWPPGGEQTLNPNERKEWLRLHRVVYRGTHDQNAERFRDFSAMGRELEAQQCLPKDSRNKALLSLAVGIVLLVVSYFVWPQTPASTANIGGSIPSSVGNAHSSSSEAPSANSQLVSMSDSVTAEIIFKEGMNAYTGAGLVPDLVTASKCFDKAAKAGYAPAQVMRGLINLDPEGAFDPTKALQWFQLAAEQGNAAGQYNMGCCFFWGVGVQKNEKEAVGWFLKAADQGFTVAEYAFGYYLLTDVSAESDARQGIPWLLKAAQKGLPEAMYLLGVLAETGDLIPRDENSALKWQKAADEKHYEPDYSKLAAWCDTDGNQSIKFFYRIHDLRTQAFPVATGNDSQGLRFNIEEVRQCVALRNSEAELWWGKHLGKTKLALPWLRRAAEQGHPEAKKWIITVIQNLSATAKQ